jgi:hypothetical protein
MILTRELVRKHKDRLVEARVKAHTRVSKKGKIAQVDAHERKLTKKQITQLSNMSDMELSVAFEKGKGDDFRVTDPFAVAAARELDRRGMNDEGMVFTKIGVGEKRKKQWWVSLPIDPKRHLYAESRNEVAKRSMDDMLAKKRGTYFGEPEKMTRAQFRKKYPRGIDL